MDIWKRSTFCSSGGCVEVGWRKSSFSDSFNSCVEVAHEGGRVLVRDSKLGDGSPVIDYSAEEWADVLAAICDDKGPIYLALPEGEWNWRDKGVRLTFTDEEWMAFLDGAVAGEFTAEALSRG